MNGFTAHLDNSLLHFKNPYMTHYIFSAVTVFTSRCLVTDVNNGYSSASVLKSRTELLSTVNWQGPRLGAISHQPPRLLFAGWLPTDNWTLSLTNQLLHVSLLNWTGSPTNYFFITILRGPNKKHRFQQGVFTDPLHRNGLHNFVLLLLRASMLRAFPSNGRCLQSHCLATGLYATLQSIFNILPRFMCLTIDGVWIGEWIYWPLIHSPLRNTSNYIATANLHNSQITTAPAKPFPACCVFTNRSLATASNSGDSSASRAQVLASILN
jgi:hypothetical protein